MNAYIPHRETLVFPVIPVCKVLLDHPDSHSWYVAYYFDCSTEYDLFDISMRRTREPVTHKQATMIKDQQQHALRFVALSIHSICIDPVPG